MIAVAARRVAAGLLLAALGPAATAQCRDCIDPVPVDCDVIEQPQYDVSGCAVAVRAKWRGLKRERDDDSCSSRVPAHTVYVPGSGHLHITAQTRGANHSGIRESREGPAFEYRDEVARAYRTAELLARKNNDTPDPNRIVADYKKVVALLDRADGGPDTLGVSIWARARGGALNRSRSWMQANVEFAVECVAPSNLLDQLLQRYGLAAFRTNLPQPTRVEFESALAVDVNLLVSRAPIHLACNDPARTYVTLGLGARAKIDQRLDVSESICYAYGSLTQPDPDPAKICEAFVTDHERLGNYSSCYAP